ncbi:hypothetical protein K402DRAFT_145701 [Aulographum hederae CBS 113979]|uniref:Velvet domain-containing protein n=1 Tax=Aulographum hederae CBS 113979 TaxID=1176131 RepID=A0A6G1GTD0_9PEZI|nr:hypothetical protein K402DRAFT_145701 [Aulographum hederae CBS 113979]
MSYIAQWNYPQPAFTTQIRPPPKPAALKRCVKTSPEAHRSPEGSSTTHTQISSDNVRLKMRQQPKEALVAVEGKEKGRKPIDPPPIVQMWVDPACDQAKHWLQSPYLFMCCTLIKGSNNSKAESASAGRFNANELSGTLSSSLHRLKDTNDRDGGYFIFGDVSVKIIGQHQLRFTLYELLKAENGGVGTVQYLFDITTDPFNVVAAKDFRGLEESTYISRAFSDQGVRLKLRKEPRNFAGNKRNYREMDDESERKKDKALVNPFDEEPIFADDPYGQGEYHKRFRLSLGGGTPSTSFPSSRPTPTSMVPSYGTYNPTSNYGSYQQPGSYASGVGFAGSGYSSSIAPTFSNTAPSTAGQLPNVNTSLQYPPYSSSYPVNAGMPTAPLPYSNGSYTAPSQTSSSSTYGSDTVVGSYSSQSSYDRPQPSQSSQQPHTATMPMGHRQQRSMGRPEDMISSGMMRRVPSQHSASSQQQRPPPYPQQHTPQPQPPPPPLQQQHSYTQLPQVDLQGRIDDSHDDLSNPQYQHHPATPQQLPHVQQHHQDLQAHTPVPQYPAMYSAPSVQPYAAASSQGYGSEAEDVNYYGGGPPPPAL